MKATFTEATTDYCEQRYRERVAENPEGEGDKEAEYVARWIRFLRDRDVVDNPLRLRRRREPAPADPGQEGRAVARDQG